MILNASGRTDICAFYMPWFEKRLKEGYVDVRNPFYPKKISRIYFEDVDLMLFCTKNPIPLLSVLDLIHVPVLVDVTITPYHREIEPGVPDKKEILAALKPLSKKIGRENLAIRYDPIFLSSRYTLAYHIKAFEKLCSQISPYASTIILSFLDEYKNVKKHKKELGYHLAGYEELKALAKAFLKTVKKYGLQIQTCYEKGLLAEFGIEEKGCLSVERAFELTGKLYPKWKARECECVQMADIGAYNSCLHKCLYCYANYDEKKIDQNRTLHNPDSSLLIGEIEDDDEIKVRKR